MRFLNESMERTELNREQQRYLEERAHQILDHLLKEQQKQAENLLERISDEIMQSSASLEQKKSYFDTIEGVFLEKRLTVSGQGEGTVLRINEMNLKMTKTCESIWWST